MTTVNCIKLATQEAIVANYMLTNCTMKSPRPVYSIQPFQYSLLSFIFIHVFRSPSGLPNQLLIYIIYTYVCVNGTSMHCSTSQKNSLSNQKNIIIKMHYIIYYQQYTVATINLHHQPQLQVSHLVLVVYIYIIMYTSTQLASYMSSTYQSSYNFIAWRC